MARAPGEPRVRYIGFRLDAAPDASARVDRRSLIEALRRAGRDLEGYDAAQPWLTRFDGRLGIVRSTHTGTDTVRTLLARVDRIQVEGKEVPVKIEPLATSGTIRTLTDGPLKGLTDTGRRH